MFRDQLRRLLLQVLTAIMNEAHDTDDFFEELDSVVQELRHYNAQT